MSTGEKTAGTQGLTRRKTPGTGVTGKGKSVQISAGDLRSWAPAMVFPETLNQLHRYPAILDASCMIATSCLMILA